ncbi:MAG: helix-turn-helix transcriptional regulator, partial [Nitrospirae bacterium]|nr:helix-turn-helix transcriptional regulator [Nitrospirota bacterium]
IQKSAPFDKLLDVVRETLESSYKGNLSDREIEIIYWVKEGKSNQEIGEILNITESTVKAHLKHLYKKLKASNRAQAIHAAISLGVIQTDKR